MDSLLIKHIIEIQNSQDSILNHLQGVDSKLINANSSSFIINYLPFIGVIIGGMLTYAGQYFLKTLDQKSQNKKALTENKNKIHLSSILLQYYLSELAYLQVDSRYQYYLSVTSDELEDRTKALDEHYKDYSYIAANKEKLAVSLADISTSIVNIYDLKKIAVPIDISNICTSTVRDLFDLPLPRAYEETEIITDDIIENDINILREKYTLKAKKISELSKFIISN